jgi:hypothetical protein
MSRPRVALIVVLLLGAFLLWRHIRQREMHRDEYECQMLSRGTATLTDCLRARGWDDRDVADAYIRELRRQQ